MFQNLTKKNAIVGGASAGIGRAVAVALAEMGANVTLLARTESALREAVAGLDTSLGQRHGYLVADFAQPDILRETVAAALAENPFHILVNNTGGPPGGPIVEAAPEAFLQAYSNHLICNQLLATLLLPGMKAAGYGRIVNIISTSVKEPIDGLGVSNATRAAVASWAKTWATEVGKFGITVNNVLPGFTKTSRLDEIIGKYAAKNSATLEATAEMLRSYVPLRRFAEPEEVAAAVAFLASPAAAYINGVNLPVDGGRTKSL